MKILYHHRIASKDGQYVHVEELTTAIKALGHELIIVGPSAVERNDFGSDDGVIKALKKYVPKFMYELAEFAYSFYAYGKLAKAIKQYRPDVIYERYNIYLPSGVWAKKRFSLPLLLEVNAPLFDERSKYDGIALTWLAHWTERYTWKNADLLFPVTNVLANRIKEEGVTESKIDVIHNGINLKKFNKKMNINNAKAKLGLEGKIVLGFVGFVREWHNLEKVVELISKKERGKFHLLVVGDGPARSIIEALAVELGVEPDVTVTGIIKREHILNYISAFDVAIQSDIVNYASPLKLFEYMILGRAIVAPNKENIREIVEDNVNALLFEPGDMAGFSKAIEKACVDSELRERIGRNARERIFSGGYDWMINAKRIEKHIYSMLHKQE